MSKDEVFQILSMIGNADIIPLNEEFDNANFNTQKRKYMKRHIHFTTMLNDFNEKWKSDYKQFCDRAILEESLGKKKKNLQMHSHSKLQLRG